MFSKRQLAFLFLLLFCLCGTAVAVATDEGRCRIMPAQAPGVVIAAVRRWFGTHRGFMLWLFTSATA